MNRPTRDSIADQFIIRVMSARLNGEQRTPEEWAAEFCQLCVASHDD
jgi:hypothetical protein